MRNDEQERADLRKHERASLGIVDDRPLTEKEVCLAVCRGLDWAQTFDTVEELLWAIRRDMLTQRMDYDLRRRHDPWRDRWRGVKVL